jgi:ribosomal protein S18 acetylase RimI-like enzyme
MTPRRQGASTTSPASGRSAVRDGSSLGTARRHETTARETLVVRRATLTDLPTVVELRIALLRENADHPVYGRLRPDARDRAYDVFGAQLRSAHEVMFLAERGGEIVGILRCVDTPNSPLLDPARYCYVSSVYVRPTARRRGVLNALLRRAHEWCAERGLPEMRLHNVPGGDASAAWSASGFAVIEEVRRKGVGEAGDRSEGLGTRA